MIHIYLVLRYVNATSDTDVRSFDTVQGTQITPPDELFAPESLQTKYDTKLKSNAMQRHAEIGSFSRPLRFRLFLLFPFEFFYY
jgi:hypothetical protein